MKRDGEETIVRNSERTAWRTATEPVSILAHVGAVVFLGFALSRATGEVTALILVGALLALAVGPAILQLARPVYVPGGRGLVVYGALVGLAWSASVLIWFPAGVFSLQLALGIAAAGAALVLAFLLHGRFAAGLAAIIGPLPIVAIMMLSDGAASSPWPAVLLGAFWLGVIWLLLQLGASARLRSAFQVEREDLIEELAQKARELEAAQAAERDARREAEQANQAKSRFLAQSSHDLRQPLHAMGLVLETLPTANEDPQVGGVVDRVKQSLAMLTQLFDSLLDLTLLDTGQIEVRPQAFSAESMLRQVRDDFAAIANSSGIDVRVAPTRLWLEADPVVVRRIIQNLVSNAIRHSGSGRVLIGARRVREGAAIDVYDTGPGIPAEDRERIFQEFTTLTAKLGRDVAPGLGLGLAIVQRFASALGLGVSVRSSVGKGSRFRLSGVRIVPAPRLAQQQAGEDVEPSASRSSRIAVFDDDVDTLNATAALLRKWGFEVDAFDKWPAPVNDGLDMLVCDYQLGADETGIDVVERVRRLSQREIPALIITGADPQMVRRETRELGLPVLAKPVGPAQLRSAILAALAPEA